MIDLPVGMAIVAVKSELKCGYKCMDEDYKCIIDCCKGCVMQGEELEGFPDTETCACFCCTPDNRKDGENTIFKLVDYPDFILEHDEVKKGGE